MRHLWSFLQCAGRCRNSLAVIERAIAIKPLAAANNYPKAQLLWILGRNAEADRVIDNALKYWPSHRFVRFARFTIFAFTGRSRAALAMLEKDETRPQQYTPEMVSLSRVSLVALEQRTPASITAARSANLEAARRNLQTLLASDPGLVGARGGRRGIRDRGRLLRRSPTIRAQSTIQAAGQEHCVAVCAVAVYAAGRIASP